MEKINKYYLIFLVIFFENLSLASEGEFFLSLKKNEVNLRQDHL